MRAEVTSFQREAAGPGQGDEQPVAFPQGQVERLAQLIKQNSRRAAANVQRGECVAQAGRQAAKTTSASAIQPRPAVMPGDQKRV